MLRRRVDRTEHQRSASRDWKSDRLQACGQKHDAQPVFVDQMRNLVRTHATQFDANWPGRRIPAASCRVCRPAFSNCVVRVCSEAEKPTSDLVVDRDFPMLARLRLLGTPPRLSQTGPSALGHLVTSADSILTVPK